MMEPTHIDSHPVLIAGAPAMPAAANDAMATGGVIDDLTLNRHTAAIAKEYQLSFLDAEHQKISNGMVALGAGHTAQLDEAVAALATVIRNALSRLVAETTRTTSYYRSQHGGSAPRRVILAGGGANLPYTLEFFQEKLNLPVEFFNPLPAITLGVVKELGTNVIDLSDQVRQVTTAFAQDWPAGVQYSFLVDQADSTKNLFRSLEAAVLTAVALQVGGKRLAALSVSRVTFAAMTPAQIDAYVATGEPLGKAGAYGIQGLAGRSLQQPDPGGRGAAGQCAGRRGQHTGHQSGHLWPGLLRRLPTRQSGAGRARGIGPPSQSRAGRRHIDRRPRA